MASKKPRKKRQDTATTTEPKIVDVAVVPSPAPAKSPMVDYRDLMPVGLYKQIQQLKERLKKIEDELAAANK